MTQLPLRNPGCPASNNTNHAADQTSDGAISGEDLPTRVIIPTLLGATPAEQTPIADFSYTPESGGTTDRTGSALVRDRGHDAGSRHRLAALQAPDPPTDGLHSCTH
jgi:hypothetical protein